MRAAGAAVSRAGAPRSGARRHPSLGRRSRPTRSGFARSGTTFAGAARVRAWPSTRSRRSGPTPARDAPSSARRRRGEWPRPRAGPKGAPRRSRLPTAGRRGPPRRRRAARGPWRQPTRPGAAAGDDPVWPGRTTRRCRAAGRARRGGRSPRRRCLRDHLAGDLIPGPPGNLIISQGVRAGRDANLGCRQRKHCSASRFRCWFSSLHEGFPNINLIP